MTKLHLAGDLHADVQAQLPWYLNGSLAGDDLSVYLSEDTGAVVALDKNTGASVWKQDKLAYRNLSAPLATKNHIVVGDYEGQVHFLKFEDGSFAVRVPTDGGGIVAAPRLVGDKVLVQTRKGGLYAISIAAIATPKDKAAK